MSRLRDWAIALGVLLLSRLPRPGPRRERRRIVPPGEPSPHAELVLIALLLAAAGCAAAFIAVYALDRLPHQTQFLGIAIGLAFAFLAAASILVGKRLVVTEQIEEDYPGVHEDEQDELLQIVEESGSRFTRKRFVVGAAGLAGGALGLALVTPAVSFGPAFDVDAFLRTPWRRGRRLVDERGRPYRAADIDEGDFYTAYPEGAAREDFGAPLVVVRLAPAELDLPRGRAQWAPSGIVAYSKICTHAGCAISLYRKPTFAPVEPRPALVCPCHYSTFDPATGGTVLFGPAGRALPQLPLSVDSAGFLRASGNFSGPVGPSWWGVRLRGPKGPAA